MHWAVAAEHKEVADLLLANKADGNAKDVNLETPQDYEAKLHKAVAADTPQAVVVDTPEPAAAETAQGVEASCVSTDTVPGPRI